MKVFRRLFSSKINNKVIDSYNKNGFAVIENLFSDERINKIKKEMSRLIEQQNPNDISTVFKAGHIFTSDYFLKSGDKVHFFLKMIL